MKASIALICVWLVMWAAAKTVIYKKGSADSQVIISAPHAGRKKSIPTRPKHGCYDSANKECIFDRNLECDGDLDEQNCDIDKRYESDETAVNGKIAKQLVKNLKKLLNKKKPHLIYSNVERLRLDVDVDSEQGTFGDEDAKEAWEKYHEYIDVAKSAATAGGRKALFINLHSHSSTTSLDETLVSYLLPDDDEDGFDKNMIPERLAQYSSIVQLHADSELTLEELVRGNPSIGGLLPDYKVIPSPTIKTYKEANSSGASAFFTGSYSLRRHTGGGISGFDIDVSKEVKNKKQVKQFSSDLAKAIQYWVQNFL